MGKKVAWNAGVFYDAPLYAGDTTTSISVVEAGTSTLITLYSDRDGSSLTNPFTISTAGKIQFYADPGRYDITATRGSDTVTWENEVIKPESIETVEKTASFQVTNDDINKMFVITGAGNVNITVPAEATETLDPDFIFHVFHDGSGTVTIVEDTGVTVVPQTGGTLVIAGPGAATCEYPRTTADRWILYGSLVQV